jgi:hypothetical protein
MHEYTKFRNKNRGYMKLEVWQKSVELYKLIWNTVYLEVKVESKRENGTWINRIADDSEDYHP